MVTAALPNTKAPDCVPNPQHLLTLENKHADSTGAAAERIDSQHQRPVLLSLAQVCAPFVQQHHGLVLPGQEPVPGVLVGHDVLQPQPAPRPPPDYGAKTHIGGAGDVRGVEGEKGAAVQHQAPRDVSLH